jgi:hypothetical protein
MAAIYSQGSDPQRAPAHEFFFRIDSFLLKEYGQNKWL